MAYDPVYTTDFAGIAEQIFPIVEGEDFYQPCGEPETVDAACCFGAKLATVYCAPRPLEWGEVSEAGMTEFWHFEDGVEWLLDAVNANHRDVCEVLFICGADEAPFGYEDWPHHPEDVVKRMWSVETPPGLHHGIVHNGMDREALFEQCTGKTWAQAEADFDRAMEEVA